VIRYGQYGRKASWIVIRYGQIWKKGKLNSEKNMENIVEK
jgi:hypothetical protein